jgi:ectoine hydroxylase-related dioxygenase (phytanoyl-CoA dioxygenase family)
MKPMRLDPDGAELHPGLALPVLAAIEGLLAAYPADRAGVRISNNLGLAYLLSAAHPVGDKAMSLLGRPARAVRAILFDKNPDANWSLDWHQDRTIAVTDRHEVPGFTNWNIKQGLIHVEPPFDLLARMLTVRIHIDPVDETNGMLEVVAGSHLQRRIAEAAVPVIAEQGPIFGCLAEMGDCWFYRTPILHRSARSGSVARRRVLQVDYSSDILPKPLDWRGV